MNSKQFNAIDSDLSLRNPARYNFIIYRINCRSRPDCVYVGMVPSHLYNNRFRLHYTEDLRMPWHYHKLPKGSYSGSIKNWPFYPGIIETINNFTFFEAIAAQQYWWEHYGGLKGRLMNDSLPLKRTQFILFRGKGSWNGYLKGFPNGWVPQI